MKVLALLNKYCFSCLAFLSLFCVVITPSLALTIDSPQVSFEKALAASKDGDFYSALLLWDQFLESFPENSAAFSNRGNVRLALGDPEGAIIDQTKSIELTPFEIDPHLNRGIAEEALKNWEQAENDYSWILQSDPDNSFALFNLANLKGAQGDWLSAERFYQKASLAKPGFVMALSGKALSDYQIGELVGAEKELRNLIRRYPMVADVRAALTALLWRQGSIGEAESNWAAVLGLDPRYKDEDWLLNYRRWPPTPSRDLMAFLALKKP